MSTTHPTTAERPVVEAYGAEWAACRSCGGGPDPKILREVPELRSYPCDGGPDRNCTGVVTRLCPEGCGEGKPEGRHFDHGDGPCSWHDGTCEEASEDPSLYCPCGRAGVAA